MQERRERAEAQEASFQRQDANKRRKRILGALFALLAFWVYGKTQAQEIEKGFHGQASSFYELTDKGDAELTKAEVATLAVGWAEELGGSAEIDEVQVYIEQFTSDDDSENCNAALPKHFETWHTQAQRSFRNAVAQCEPPAFTVGYEMAVTVRWGITLHSFRVDAHSFLWDAVN